MENSEGLTLLGFWCSPSVIRVKWALQMKGITNYEYLEEDLMHKSCLLLKLNQVHKQVPVFIHNGNAISESLIILEYIEETWKHNPLFPKDPCEKAQIRFLAKFGDKLLQDAYTATWSEGEAKENIVKSTIEGFEKIEEEIKGKKYFGGETIGFLDVALGWISFWLPIWEEVGFMKLIDPLKFPAITLWVQKFLSIPLIEDMLPSKTKILMFIEEYMSSKK